MANLKVRMKDGTEREMTQKVFDLLGHKRKPKIIGNVEVVKELSEIDKIKADLRAQKAANQIVEPSLDLPKSEDSIEPIKKKGGRPPKQKQDEI